MSGRFPVLRMEWTLALRRRRLLVLNAGIPLLLVLPLSIGGAPPFHAAAAYAVLFALFGTFGSAIPLLREGDGGPLRRMILTGAPLSGFVGQRLLAGTALDLAQLLPSLLLIFILGGADGATWIGAFPALAIAILAANAVGVWVAAAARSIAEGALFAAVVTLFLLHGSSVFRAADPGSWGARLEAVLPYAPLHRNLLAGAAGGGDGTSAAMLALPTIATLLLLFATLAAAPRLLDRISQAR